MAIAGIQPTIGILTTVSRENGDRVLIDYKWALTISITIIVVLIIKRTVLLFTI